MTEKQEKAKKLSTEPYKGVRDFYPADMAIQNYIFGKWKKTAESFGYEEYGASVLEPADMYRAKSGEEIVNEQTYTFTDRGEREVTLRPEMTPTVARMVVARKRELAFPLRWYSIPNLFRYEQPQRGRVREHWQLNVDLFGVDSIEADIEVISLAYQVMKDFGAKDEDFEIQVNSRDLLREMFKGKLKSEEDLSKAVRLLDRRQKMKPAEFDAAMKELTTSPVDMSIVADGKVGKILANFKELGIHNVRFEPTLARGFDYYTGMVFEIYDTSPENRRALFGGGRYDDLTSLFALSADRQGGDKIPAVGFGMGDVGMRNFLETHGLLPKAKGSADYYICVMSEAEAAFAEKIARQLRNDPQNGGSRVAVDFTYKKIGDQIKGADKRGIPNVIVIGAEEVKNGKAKVKNLETGQETDL
ncbi:MAG: histidine--tRNA ligase [Candidatus Pacebacteria bacterium]|nr:histidine--tRNA ligase [Candidatus Paceibacterota bacterium]